MSLIELKNMNKYYGKADGKVKALDDINLNIEKGEMVAIMGASGSGKSTLLNILGCLDKPSQGRYILNGQEVGELSKNKQAQLRGKFFGFIVQYFALIDEYNVYQNVMVPLNYTKLSKKEKNQRIEKRLKELGILDKIKRKPSELSGGQNQRVAIARALVNNPEVILADEPTGALDSKNGEEVMRIFKEINAQGKTVIIVTHDINVAKKCKKIVTLKDGKINSIQDVEEDVKIELG